MRVKLEPRPQRSRLMSYLSPLLAAALTGVTGLIVFTLFGLDPGAAFYTFFVSPIDDRYGLGELGLKATPLMLIAVGLAVGFRANVWNIGAEGQLVAGAIFGGGLALWFHGVDSPWLLPAMVVAGAVGGMLWAAVPALLRTRFNTNEILVSLMLVYVAELLLDYLVRGPWRDPAGFGFPESKLFHEAATMPLLLGGTRLHAGLLIALGAVLVGWVFIQRSFLGYQMRVAGLAAHAAAYAGFRRSRMVWMGLLAGGGAAGMAGVGEVAGPIGQLLPSVSPGYGFAAIIVAFVGRLHPLGILLASLLMALLYLGGEAAQMQLGLPAAVTGVFQGVLLFFLLASDVFINFRLRVVRAAPAAAAAPARAEKAEEAVT
ncbi:MAG: ABC transporter permease [Gammaproteobacteria bacterium]|nr:ABC transporter permease [Gammaproteobacteria bacterium]NIR88829.1 ABC transporter permease [Gammaproteobacteria bacterium]NIU06433.1 ABC transporter permease [Gammaproteobacteria bacterium]NIV53325.1 ABC transporter permease [Gammaproteobacteria bacterium]NIV74044.1 ABC transporter permease [Gammaproteobacteria bacterium]